MYLVDILKNIKLSIRNSSNKIICILLYVLLLFVLNPFIIFLKLRRKFYLLKIRFYKIRINFEKNFNNWSIWMYRKKSSF